MFDNKTSQNNNHFQFIDDTEECITISLSPENIEQAKPREQDYSNDWARYNAWINRLSVNAICKWLQEEIETDERIQIWEEDLLHTIWEVVNGTAINLSGKRIILIPREDLDTEEFIVPAEWIKIHDWIGDYYLAVQVNLEHRWLRVWGCTTHKQIMQKGEYDSVWRNYCIGVEELVSDIDVMLVARKHDAVNKLDVALLPSLTRSQVNELMAELKQPSSFSPRYKVDINRWSAITKESHVREGLYFQRCTQSYKIPRFAKTTNLQNWLEEKADKTWQQISQVIYPSLQPEFALLLDENLVLDKSVALAKFIYLSNSIFGLYVQVTCKQKEDFKLIISVCSSIYSDSKHLPEGFKIVLLNNYTNKIIQEIKTTENNSNPKKLIIPKIKCNSTITLKVFYNNSSYTEILKL